MSDYSLCSYFLVLLGILQFPPVLVFPTKLLTYICLCVTLLRKTNSRCLEAFIRKSGIIRMKTISSIVLCTKVNPVIAGFLTLNFFPYFIATSNSQKKSKHINYKEKNVQFISTTSLTVCNSGTTQ